MEYPYGSEKLISKRESMNVAKPSKKRQYQYRLGASPA